jgi:outer membrane protein W
MWATERPRFRGVAARRLAAAAAGLLLCLTAGAARAQSGPGEYLGRWSVSGELGAAIPNTDQYGDVLSWRLGVGYSRDPRFEIGVDLGRFSTGVSQPEPDGLPNHTIASGTLDVVPLCLTVRYHLPVAASMFSVSLLGGAGYYLVDYTMAAAPRAALGLADQVVDDAFGFHAGAGLEYAVAGWLSLTVEGRYVFLSPGVSGTAKDGVTLGGSLNLNTWLFTGGIKLSF